jgi:4-amino-4-deoxy-L-arabinose transferase-like glycosyltransferase
MDTATPVSNPLARPFVRAGASTRVDPWSLYGFAGVVALAAFLYLAGLTISGYANTYYAMAAQAASQSWTAWFFGSLDASNFITVDKPPLATMVLGLSVRLFGLSSWSILLPEALMGVAAVAVTFLVVRRSFGPVAATIAGLVMALTPAAVLMFRYDNPDALLTLLLVTAAYALLRSLDRGALRWVALAALLVGLGFMTKYLQAFLVLPVFGLVWLVAAKVGWPRRIGGLALAGAITAVVSFAWPTIVELIPLGSRPYIGGSTNGSAFDLIFGYDGLGRIFGGIGNGGAGGGPGGGAAGGGFGGGFGGAAGILRLFNSEFGGQVSWLLPYAAVGLVSGVILRLRRGRTDARLAGFLLWGGWLVVTGLVFSLMSGVIHPYYSVILAPAIGALAGGGTVELWKLRKRSVLGGVGLAMALVSSGIWAWALLERTPAFWPGLGIAVLFVSVAVAILVVVPDSTWRTSFAGVRVPAIAIGIGLAALLAGPAAYAVDTMQTAYSGGDPQAGPSATAGGFGGGFAGGLADGPGGAIAGDGGAGSAESALVDYLVANAGSARWIVAVNGSGSAAGIQLASGLPVLTMGGFNGSDPAPTLEQLQQYISSGELRYVLIGGDGRGFGRGGGFGGPGGGPGGFGGSNSSSVSSWVSSACTAVDTGASSGTLYDCSAAISG